MKVQKIVAILALLFLILLPLSAYSDAAPDPGGVDEFGVPNEPDPGNEDPGDLINDD